MYIALVWKLKPLKLISQLKSFDRYHIHNLLLLEMITNDMEEIHGIKMKQIEVNRCFFNSIRFFLFSPLSWFQKWFQYWVIINYDNVINNRGLFPIWYDPVLYFKMYKENEYLINIPRNLDSFPREWILLKVLPFVHSPEQ